MSDQCNSIYLYGLGGHSNVVRDVLQCLNLQVLGIYEDDAQKRRTHGDLAKPGIAELPEGQNLKPSAPMILAIGNNRVRQRLSKRIAAAFVTAIHPSAIVSESASIAEGSVVFAAAIVQANTNIGRHCIVNTAASVDHDCKLDDFVHISPNATLCGNVSVGEGTQVGASATVIPNIKIGKWCTIGAGAVIIRNVPDGATVVGAPGRIIKTNESSVSTSEEIPEAIRGKLISLFNEVLRRSNKPKVETLNSSDRLQADLNLDSLELAELTIRIDAEYGVDVFADGIVATVSEIASKIQRRQS